MIEVIGITRIIRITIRFKFIVTPNLHNVYSDLTLFQEGIIVLARLLIFLLSH